MTIVDRSKSERQVEELLGSMSLAEKIGQMAQVEVNSIEPDEVRDWAIGSVLSGGGGNPTPNTARSWAERVRRYQQAALRSRIGVPILYGVDAVHGHNNVFGATIVPHNIGLGATRDPDLVARLARMTACEMLATNVHWTFAPSATVPQDIRWGRAYEGFGERTDLVSELVAAHIRGLVAGSDHHGSGQSVLASAKHFVGDGGTSWGTTRSYPWIPGWWQSPIPDRWQIDQGDLRVDEATLRRVHLPPYLAAIVAGARTIMASYNSWNGIKVHASRRLLTEVLKGELGFDGVVVSDWLGVGQLNSDFDEAVAMAVNAGLDMVMIPYDCRRFISAVTQLVERGRIAIQRIDDACRRILRVKAELDLFARPFGDESLIDELGGEAHRLVAREAVGKSLVLLKNNRRTLPASPATATVLVAGVAADDIGRQCGGWTIEWQGGNGAITAGTTLLEAVRTPVESARSVVFDVHADPARRQRAELGIAVLAEPPYAEGEGDRADLALPRDDIDLVRRIRERCDRLVVVLYSGRPVLIGDVLDLCDAFVAAWLPGTEGSGITDALFGNRPFAGRLPVTWPATMDQVRRGGDAGKPLFPYGFGMTTQGRGLP